MTPLIDSGCYLVVFADREGWINCDEAHGGAAVSFSRSVIGTVLKEDWERAEGPQACVLMFASGGHQIRVSKGELRRIEAEPEDGA